MLANSFFTALVAFTINFSLADLFAKKRRYNINPSQELLASGLSNVFASFFSCFASGASLARSCVQFNSGGQTQFVSIVSSAIIGIVLLYVAPLFKPLPQACLASIIVVSLKTLLMQLGALPYYWKVNKIEFVSIEYKNISI
jgi:solute carrier family 26 protein